VIFYLDATIEVHLKWRENRVCSGATTAIIITGRNWGCDRSKTSRDFFPFFVVDSADLTRREGERE
jgi:hypothetical protein